MHLYVCVSIVCDYIVVAYVPVSAARAIVPFHTTRERRRRTKRQMFTGANTSDTSVIRENEIHRRGARRATGR